MQKRIEVLDALAAAMERALSLVTAQPTEIRCRICEIVDVWGEDRVYCRACGGSPAPTLVIIDALGEFVCPRCGYAHFGEDRPPGLTPAGICPSCELEPQSLAVGIARYDGHETHTRWTYDPVGAVKPNVICSRCAVVSYWARGFWFCRVCGVDSDAKVTDDSNWPWDATPYICPACGLHHFGRDRLPSPLGTRSGMCPCGYDPLSFAVPGPNTKGIVGQYAYLDAIGTYQGGSER